MQTTATRTAGSHTDLLTGILNVQVRNEDKITEQDRQYCQLQQDQLYRTLDRIDRWYDIFKEEAERYREIKSFKYEDNGKVSIRNFYFNNSGEDDYTHNEFKPFDLINELADNNCNANANFASRIISYFNRTYNVDVPIPVIDEKAMRMGFRPVYQTYVDMVIEHLGGKSFRETAEEELLARFLKTVQPSRWSKVKAYGADDVINGSSGMVIGLDRRDVDITEWYNLTLSNAEQIKFYKNGRIDVRFKDSQAAENCYRRLRLDEITLREE